MKYYVNQNSQSNGDHEVHTYVCTHGPDLENRQYLGEYYGCGPAVTEAKRYYALADGCFYCCNPCHKS
jgi:hypothetical protein